MVKKFENEKQDLNYWSWVNAGNNYSRIQLSQKKYLIQYFKRLRKKSETQ